jgi:hypothetical protein
MRHNPQQCLVGLIRDERREHLNHWEIPPGALVFLDVLLIKLRIKLRLKGALCVRARIGSMICTEKMSVIKTESLPIPPRERM